MDNMNNEFTCPCMPQCPNYGKCRECILEHGKYYTVPKCVKLMQDEMKQKHIHPVNPHVKKPLAERISEFYEKNPGSHLRTVAEELKVTEWQVLDAMETAIPVPVEDFAEIYGKLRELDLVMLHLDAGSVVLQLTTALPEAIENGHDDPQSGLRQYVLDLIDVRKVILFHVPRQRGSLRRKGKSQPRNCR